MNNINTKNNYNFNEIIQKFSICDSLEQINNLNKEIFSSFFNFSSYELFLLSNSNNILHYSTDSFSKFDNLFLKKSVFDLIIHEFSDKDYFYLSKKALNSDLSNISNENGYLLDLLECDNSIFFRLKNKNKDFGFIAFIIDNEIKEENIDIILCIINLFSIFIHNFINELIVNDKSNKYEHNNEEFKLLFYLTSKLNAITDYKEATELIVEQISTFLYSKKTLFMEISISKNKYIGKIISSLEKNIDLQHYNIDISEKTMEAIIKHEVIIDNFIREFDSLGFKNFIIFPILIKEKPVALIFIDFDKKDKNIIFSPEKINVIRTILNQTVITLENIHLYSDMQDMVIERTLEIAESNEELKKQKYKLEVANKKLQSIISNIPDSIMVINENNKIINYNKAFEKLISIISGNENIPYLSGYKLSEINDFIISAKNKKIFDSLLLLLNNNELDFYETDFNIEDKFYYKILTAPVIVNDENETEIINKIIVFHDITKDKEIEKMKSDFMAVVSHELKTPVSAMMGFANLMEDGFVGDVTEGQLDYLSKIQTQGERLIRLINDLLDFSKLQSGHMPMYNQLLDASENVFEVIEMLRPLIEEKNMEITTQIEDNLSPIYIDPDKIKQILINLIGNAIKFTPENTGLIEVIVKSYNDSILFQIKDNGIGIIEKNQKRLFEKFYQADNTSTRKYGGTGLGLAIVKKLVELNNGKVWFESKENEGTCFSFTIPINKEKISN